MLEQVLERFPTRGVLRDGSPFSIRPPELGDELAFRDFHRVIPEREQLFVRSQIQDGSLFRELTSDPSFEDQLPLLAFVDGRMVAFGLLRLRAGGWKRHIGKVFFLTHPDYTGLGLIDQLLEQIIDSARHSGLIRLESELNGERQAAIASMVAVGFRELVRLPGYIQDMRADYHDYVMMGIELIAPFEFLGTGD